jgi:hypothetical protein
MERIGQSCSGPGRTRTGARDDALQALAHLLALGPGHGIQQADVLVLMPQALKEGQLSRTLLKLVHRTPQHRAA